MPRKANELVEKWLKYKDTDKTKQINVKQDIGLGGEIAGSHEAQHYRGTVLYIELRINFRTRDLTAMRKQQTQAGEAKKRKLHRYATIDWGYGHSIDSTS